MPPSLRPSAVNEVHREDYADLMQLLERPSRRSPVPNTEQRQETRTARAKVQRLRFKYEHSLSDAVSPSEHLSVSQHLTEAKPHLALLVCSSFWVVRTDTQQPASLVTATAQESIPRLI
jgi:hypothetical protein